MAHKIASISAGVLAAVAALLLSAAKPGDPEQSAFGGLVRYRMPRGWSQDKAPSPDQPGIVELSEGPGGSDRRIRIRIERGNPADSDAVAELMKAPWDSEVQRPAERREETVVSDVETTLWRRYSSAPFLQEAGQSSPYRLDEFCTIPMKEGFLLLVLSVGKNGPFTVDEAADKTWRAFLGSLQASTAESVAQAMRTVAGRTRTWRILTLGGKEVMQVRDAPGILYSATPTSENPPYIPFLSGTMLDPNEERRVRGILDHCQSFKDFVDSLKDEGYQVQPSN
ncbi:MAG: hypothetical protein NTX64_11290 [Elusimicrobia bacterium]|nr:hypothetical protein [Elusimicrobiota bacterium]